MIIYSVVYENVKLNQCRVTNEGLIAVPLERKARWQHFNRHLDYIFYRGLSLIKAETVSTINSSDHFPITAEFKIDAQSITTLSEAV